MNLLKDSDRDEITARPLCISSCQSAGRRSFDSSVDRLPAMDLIGVSELFNSWPALAHELVDPGADLRPFLAAKRRVRRQPIVAELADAPV